MHHAVYFKIFRVGPTGAEVFVSFVFESGKTFVATDFTKFIIYMDRLGGAPYVEAEVWVQAKS